MNTAGKLLVNTLVTGSARPGDIDMMNARFRIGRWQYMVCCVAVGAHGRDYQAALQKSLAVNAHRVVANPVNNTVGGVPLTNYTIRAMAACAEFGNVAGECWRQGIQLPPGLVSPMAAGTIRGLQITTIVQHSVRAGGVGFDRSDIDSRG